LVAKDKIPISENIPFKKKDVGFGKCFAQKQILTLNIIGKIFLNFLVFGSTNIQLINFLKNLKLFHIQVRLNI